MHDNSTHTSRDTQIDACTHAGWKHAAWEQAESHVHTHTGSHTDTHIHTLACTNSCFQHAEAVWKPLPLSGSNRFSVHWDRQEEHFHCAHMMCVCAPVCMSETEKNGQKTMGFYMFGLNKTVIMKNCLSQHFISLRELNGAFVCGCVCVCVFQRVCVRGNAWSNIKC